MSELEKNILKLQDMILFITRLFMSGKTAEPVKLYQVLTQTIELVLLGMIQEYQARGLEQYISEIEYWKDQVARITEAIQSEDYFRIIDTLYFETRENLENFNKMLSERETNQNDE